MVDEKWANKSKNANIGLLEMRFHPKNVLVHGQNQLCLASTAQLINGRVCGELCGGFRVRSMVGANSVWSSGSGPFDMARMGVHPMGLPYSNLG